MKMFRGNDISFYFILLILSLLLPQEAFAYIDPSTGSYALQLIFGSVFATAFVIQSLWRSVLQRITKQNQVKQSHASRK